jgi:hypothetical protein
MIRRPVPVAAAGELPSEEAPGEAKKDVPQHNPIFETGKDH